LQFNTFFYVIWGGAKGYKVWCFLRIIFPFTKKALSLPYRLHFIFDTDICLWIPGPLYTVKINNVSHILGKRTALSSDADQSWISQFTYHSNEPASQWTNQSINKSIIPMKGTYIVQPDKADDSKQSWSSCSVLR